MSISNKKEDINCSELQPKLKILQNQVLTDTICNKCIMGPNRVGFCPDSQSNLKKCQCFV
jgi:hypothetical protein